MVPSEQLLRQYVDENSEEAFKELVERHLNMVYSAALRQVDGDAALASDIAQDVFADLVRKARSIPQATLVAGWLYRHTRFTTAKALRGESRRRVREKEAVAMSATNSSEDLWSRLAPVVDDAMSELGDTDRNAVVLRFFEGQDLRTVGTVLGTNEDAAQKRISRALDKLRISLTRRGVVLPVTALGALLAANGVVGAPAGMAAAITGTALCAGTVSISLIGKLLLMANLKTVTTGALIVAGLGTPLVLQYKAFSRMKLENDALRVRMEVMNRPAAPAEAPVQITQADRIELMRLRGEAAQWRTQQQELTRLQAENKQLRSNLAQTKPAEPKPPQNPDYLPRESWADAGFATPQAALQTLSWAVGTGNIQRFKDSVFITDSARKYLTDVLASMHPQALEEAAKRGWGVEEGLMFPMMAHDKKEGFKALRINTQDMPAPDEVVFRIDMEMNAGQTHSDRMRFKRVGDDWKRLYDLEDLPVAQKK